MQDCCKQTLWCFSPFSATKFLTKIWPTFSLLELIALYPTHSRQIPGYSLSPAGIYTFQGLTAQPRDAMPAPIISACCPTCYFLNILSFLFKPLPFLIFSLKGCAPKWTHKCPSWVLLRSSYIKRLIHVSYMQHRPHPASLLKYVTANYYLVFKLQKDTPQAPSPAWRVNWAA